MKYLKRINESLNSKTLTKEEVIELLKKNCQKFLSYPNKNQSNLIFRKDEERGDFSLINPKLSTSQRIAPYAPTNVHNLLISNLDSWKGWPRRNKSLIFASAKSALYHTSEFSDVEVDYVVVPFDSTEVATGDRSDFWNCFGKIPNRRGFQGDFMPDDYPRPSISWYVWHLMRNLKIKEEYPETDWQKIKTLLEETELVDQELIKIYFEVEGEIIWNPNMTLLENLNQLLDPIYNEFKLGDITSTMNLYSQVDTNDTDYLKHALESWCEDEVILIKYSMLDTILNELEN
jgi:uncharacterized protein with HEPN domain